MRKIVTVAQTLRKRTRDSVTLVPGLARKPTVLRHWLLSARWAQLALLLVIIAMPSFIPSAVDARLEKIYPPITTKELFGLIKNIRPDSRLENRQKLARLVLWGGSGSLVIFLFLLHIPQAINRATVIARSRENRADQLAESQPSKSILLYSSALSLAFDPDYEASLRDKLRRLDNQISERRAYEDGERPEPKEKAGVAHTIVLEAGSEQPSQNGIGPGGRYLIKRELGRGAMGIVYRCHDSVLCRDLALKQLSVYVSQDKTTLVRFQKEARALARLSHPNIVQVYDFIQDGNLAWIAMELVEGEELEEHLQESGPLPIEKTVRLGVQFAEALAYAHVRGVIHRDFKPANVLLTQDGIPKITDFGLAKLTQSTVYTQEGSVLGSPAYMSPEQASGKGTDMRSDIYALGVTMYQMLTSHVPFEGDVASVIAQKLTKEPTPLPDLDTPVPEQLRCLISQMLNKDPDKRPRNMDAVAEALRTISNA